MSTIFIYTLEHPLTGEIRYVGKSISPQKRLINHIKVAKDRMEFTHKANWIRRLLKNNLRPVLQIIDEVPESEWVFWERYWIQQIKSWGFNLTNNTEGGEGAVGNKHRKRTKKLLSEIAKNAHQKGRHQHLFSKQCEETILKRKYSVQNFYLSGKQSKKSKKVKVINIENKEEKIFNSVSQAATLLQLKYQKVNDACHNKGGSLRHHNRHKGFEFYFLE